MANLKIKIAVVSFVLILAGVLGYMTRDTKPQGPQSIGDSGFSVAPKDPSLLEAFHSPTLGPSDAPVTIVEFLDPECEACRAMHPIVKTLMDEFNGKVRLVIRYMPFHGNSVFAANVLESAREQNKYWEALHLLFEEQPAWASHHDPKPELVFSILRPLGLDTEKLQADAKAGKFNQIIDKDRTDGEKLGVNRTPTFFVNGEELLQMGYEPLKDLIAKKINATQ